jgi:ankyrin repeat protein
MACYKYHRCRIADHAQIRRIFRLLQCTMTEDLARAVIQNFVTCLRSGLAAMQVSRLDKLEDAAIDALGSSAIAIFWTTLRDRDRKQQSSSQVLPLHRTHEEGLLSKAADCAYQLAIACLEGIGVQQDSTATLEIMALAWRMGSQRAYSDLPILVGAITGDTLTCMRLELESRWNNLDRTLMMTQLFRQCLTGHDNSVATERVLRHYGHDFQKLYADRIIDDLCSLMMSNWTILSGEDWRTVFQPHSPYLNTLGPEPPRDWPPFLGNDMTILHYAVFSGRLDAVKYLVEDVGADIHALDEDGFTPFDNACLTNNTAILSYLLDQLENEEIAFPPGTCPLQNLACLSTSEMRVIGERIIQLGGKSIVQRKNRLGFTPLLGILHPITPILIEPQHVVADILLEHGANPLESARSNSPSAIGIAASELKPEIVRSMLRAARELESAGLLQVGQSVVDSMAQASRQLIVMSKSRIMLEGGANWERKASDVLEQLVNEEVIRRFPETFNDGVQSMDLLSFCCRYNNFVLEWFLTRYSDMELKALFPDTFETTLGGVLRVVMDCGNIERAKVMLLMAIESPHFTRSSLLHDAMHHQPSLVPVYAELLKDVGAGEALFETNAYGETVFDIALQYGHIPVMKYLLQQGATYCEYRLNPDFRVDQSPCSPLALVLGYKKQVNFMLSLEPRPSLIVTESGINVFHVLASRESVLGILNLISRH